jgi:hypothetical protein
MVNCVVNWRGKEIRFRTDCFNTYKRIRKILEWVHKRKFPDVTEDEQIEKVWEEWHELKSAYYKSFWASEKDLATIKIEYYYEMADVLFALHGLRRFDEGGADVFLADLGSYYPLESNCVPLMIEKLLEVYFIRTYVNNRHI